MSLAWTRSAPTVDGWYWRRDEGRDVVVEVKIDVYGMALVWTVDGRNALEGQRIAPTGHSRVMWVGPIEAPPPPVEEPK